VTTVFSYQKPLPKTPFLVLGIESSCDETAASVLRYTNDSDVKILSSIIASQDAEHAPFGGVVPEIAALLNKPSQMRALIIAILQALRPRLAPVLLAALFPDFWRRRV